MARLGDICTIYTGTGFPVQYQGCSQGRYPFYKVGDIAKNVIAGNIYLEFCDNYVDADVVKKIKGNILPARTVVFAKIGEAVKLNRRAITSCECLIDNNAMGISPNEDIVTLDYFFYYMCSLRLETLAEATTVPSVKKSLIEKLEIPLPSVSEQERISERLHKVSELIALRKEQLAKLDQLVKSRFVEMFGDPVQNSMSLPVHQLSEHIKFLTSGSRGWAQYFAEQGEYFITIKNVKNCRITLNDVQHIIPPNNAEAVRTKVQEGDLLISITADLGRTGVVTKDIAEHGAYINQHLTCIRLDRAVLNPLYVAYYMESDAGKEQFQAKNQNGVKAGLNFNAINSLRLFVPPMELQERFVHFAEKTDRAKLTIQASLDKLELLKKSLMQQNFG